jgi:uncharacterized membrane protein
MHPAVPARREPDITPDEWRAFGAGLFHAAGLGSLGAGLVFFVAANWQAWGLAGRFGLLQAGLLVCVAAALWQPPPARVGQGALLLATLFAGALLALFGQSYQTGADAYELFFAWALLTVPFAVAASSGAVWAAWWVVLDVGLGLLCGQPALGRFDAFLVDGWGRDRAALLMLPCLANLLGAVAFLALGRTRFADAAPAWLARFLLTVGLGYGTAAALPGMSDHGVPVIALYAVISTGIGVATWVRRQDVFPLAALSGSWIVTSTAWLAHTMRLGDIGALFILALWLIGSSTVAAKLLMHWLPQGRASGAGGAER